LLGTPEGTIYVYGRVEYRDAFGEDRWMNYRLIYGGIDQTHGKIDKGMREDHEGNDTSES
jgi:hypothetical protein